MKGIKKYWVNIIEKKTTDVHLGMLSFRCMKRLSLENIPWWPVSPTATPTVGGDGDED